jgi:plastocyanin
MRCASIVGAVLLFSGLACSEDETGLEDCTPSSTRVCMRADSFEPTALTVARGSAVTWRNGDAAAHTATSNPGNPAGCPTFDATANACQSTAAVTFNPAAAVICQYYCKLHATPTSGNMRGTIVVQ